MMLRRVLRLYAGRDESKSFSVGMIILLCLLYVLAMQTVITGNLLISAILGVANGFRFSNIMRRT